MQICSFRFNPLPQPVLSVFCAGHSMSDHFQTCSRAADIYGVAVSRCVVQGCILIAVLTRCRSRDIPFTNIQMGFLHDYIICCHGVLHGYRGSCVGYNQITDLGSLGDIILSSSGINRRSQCLSFVHGDLPSPPVCFKEVIQFLVAVGKGGFAATNQIDRHIFTNGLTVDKTSQNLAEVTLH